MKQRIPILHLHLVLEKWQLRQTIWCWIRSDKTEIHNWSFVIFFITFIPFCLGWILDLNLVNLDGNLRNLTPESYSLHIPVAEQINQAEETHNTIPLQFTMEEETKHQLIFLDILITLIENGLNIYIRTIFRCSNLWKNKIKPNTENITKNCLYFIHCSLKRIQWWTPHYPK